MFVCDDYLALRALAGALPAQAPNEPASITTTTWWRLLLAQQEVTHSTGPAAKSPGQLSTIIRELSPGANLAPPIDESSAESWGPCAEQVGSYLNAVVFGGLVAELESELPKVAVEAQVKAGEIFAAHCEAQDAEKSDDGCEQDLVGLVTSLYPVHREIAAELLRLDLVD